MSYRPNTFVETVSNLLVILFAGGAATIGIGAFLFLAFFNVIIGAFIWPSVGNMIAVASGHTPIFVWWQGALFSLVPFIGRWYVGVLLWIFVWLCT